MNQNERPAKGTRGLLILDVEGGFFFRIYRSFDDFSDYRIAYPDLEVMLLALMRGN